MTTIEQHIQAAGANVAPRITPDDIKANIIGEYYFTAAEGVSMSTAIPAIPSSLSLLTFCVLLLKNGFTVTGESACASPENFNADIGRRIARENAVAKIWPLMGYELRGKLHAIETAIPPVPTTFQDRVRAEAAELDERVTKLKAFTSTDSFGGLPVDEQERMLAQLAAMTHYSACLAERIQHFQA